MKRTTDLASNAKHANHSDGGIAMRFLGYLIALVVALSVQSLPGQEPSAGAATSEMKSARQFVVQCHFAGKGMNDLTSPKLVVRDGEKKSSVNAEQKSFIIGKKTDKTSPLIRQELNDGFSLEAAVFGDGDDEAILDLTFEMSAIATETTKNGGVHWIAKKYRVIDCVTLGKKIVAEFDNFNLEIVVNAVTEVSPGITKPIASAANCGAFHAP